MMENQSKVLLLLLVFLAASESLALITNRGKTKSLKGRWEGTINTISGRSQSDECTDDHHQQKVPQAITRRNMISTGIMGVTTSSIALSLLTGRPLSVEARPDSVNRPELLPKEPGLNVIQIEKFLTSGQVKRMDQLLTSLEHDTGFRVRVLCQAYPYTPGLAIRDYWDLGKEDQKDDKYVVLVVDEFGGKGNVLNFNVGDGVKLVLPNST